MKSLSERLKRENEELRRSEEVWFKKFDQVQKDLNDACRERDSLRSRLY